MHLVERYALGTGCKIGKPYIHQHYFPLHFGKFITLHTTTKDAKTYDYWADVMDLIVPELKKQGIHILQIGGEKEKQLDGAVYLCGQTSINQTAYIIDKAMAHVGVDSFPVHIASAYGKKIVALYSTSYISNCGPYWSSKEDRFLLQPERAKGVKPSFSFKEGVKQINTIKPEDVAAKIFEALGIPFTYGYKTLSVGGSYKHKLIEAVPDSVIDTRNIGVNHLTVRMDYTFNEENLARQLQVCRCSIITDRPINIELLKKFRENVSEIYYNVDGVSSPKFAHEMRKFGLKYGLLTDETDEEKINSLKFDYLDYGIIHPRKNGTAKDVLGDIPPEKAFYKSRKFVLGRGGIYPSRVAMENGVDKLDNFGDNIQPVIDHPNFWKDSEFHKFLTVKDSS
jgi:hypothetical protein